MKNILKNSFMGIFLLVLLLMLFVSSVILINSIIYPDQVPSFFGWEPFIAVSDSMIDAINPGDLVIVKKIKNEEPKVGDIIAFDFNNSYITHRIADVKIKDDDILYVTKGDNNPREDANFVKKSEVEGILRYRVASLGKVALFLQTPIGAVISLFIPIMLIIYQKWKITKNEKEELKKKIKELEEEKD